MDRRSGSGVALRALRAAAVFALMCCAAVAPAAWADEPPWRKSHTEDRAPPGGGAVDLGIQIEPEVAIIDSDASRQVIGGFIHPSAESTVQVTVRNKGAVPILNTTIQLNPRPDRNIDVVSGPVNIPRIPPLQGASAVFRIKTSDTPPGIFSLRVTGDSSAGPFDEQVVLFVARTEVDLSEIQLGRVKVTLDGPDGRYVATLFYNPSVFTIAPTATCNCMEMECIEFYPNPPFEGVHPPSWPSLIDEQTNWIKKVLAGLVDFIGGDAAALGADLAGKGFDVSRVARLVNRVGLRRTLGMLAARLTPGIGTIALIWGLCAAVASALAADPPAGDFFFVGEQNTPPPPGLLTVMEKVSFQFSLCQTDPRSPAHVMGFRVFERMLSDQSVLRYEEPFDVALDTVLNVVATTDRGVYNVGESVIVEARVLHPLVGPLSGPQAVVTAAIRPQAGSVEAGVMLRDDGQTPDLVAGDGLYTGTVPLTSELVCSVAGDLPLLVLAQRTTQGFMRNEIPEFYAGLFSTSIMVNPAQPRPDLAFHSYQIVPEELVIDQPSSARVQFFNAGQAPSNPSQFRVLLSLDTQPDVGDLVLSNGPLSPLPPGMAGPAATGFVVPGTAAPGPAFLLFIVDPNNNVPECNENNNVAFWPVDVVRKQCYADCDMSTGPGVLDIFDFLCFGNRFTTGEPYACNCDESTGPNVCDIFDFLCFGNAFNAGCP